MTAMAHEFEVLLFDYRVGTLTLLDGLLNFCYAHDWLSHKDAVALSASLPLQAEPFDDRKTSPFFASLLPEGQMRHLIAQQFQVSGQHDFALLDHIGGECAGAPTLPCWQVKTACGFPWRELKLFHLEVRRILLSRSSGATERQAAPVGRRKPRQRSTENPRLNFEQVFWNRKATS
jgi:HipA-like protein